MVRIVDESNESLTNLLRTEDFPDDGYMFSNN